MTITQLSAFVENRAGRINQITRILGDNGINLQAFCLAESSDFGILRMVVSDVERASELLRAAHIAVSRTQVVALSCANTAGSLSQILDHLAAQSVFIEYMYAFAEGDTARVVIRPTNIEVCLEALQNTACQIITTTTL
ncbi:MAG: amino acid-binding protein [Mucinivorans sp.]